MKNIFYIFLAIWAGATWCSAAIKPAPPRSGLAAKEEPKAKSQPLESKPTPTSPVLTSSTQADPLTPSPSLLKSLSAVEKIHANPAQARQAITGCENLRNPLATYPAYFQKLNCYWAVALANSGNLDDASQKFAIASASSAPDRAMAIHALNQQTRYLLRSPSYVEKAIALSQSIVARTQENSPEQIAALFHTACGHFLLGRSAPAIVILEKIDNPLNARAGNPEAFILKQHASNLLSAIYAAKAAQDPDNPP
ncbi:MAG TPA: hypothetical protein VF258_10975, partial [Luteolibacter sp.]